MDSLLTHSKSFDLPAGAECPATGIYVVTHRNPPHALPHEVLIAAPSVLPRCKTCADVRFSLMRLPVEAIHENEHFRDVVLSSWTTRSSKRRYMRHRTFRWLLHENFDST